MAPASMTARCGAIVLAAGMSRRMGSNKLIANLHGKPLVAHVVDAIAAAGLPAPIVVLGHAAYEIRVALEDRDVAFATAERHAEGMAHSLAAGIAAVPPDWESTIVCLGDMPRIAPDLLRRLAQESTPSAIVLPIFAGRRGNPVLWGRDYFGEIRSLKGDSGAKTLFARYADRITEIPWSDDSIHADVDTIDALNQLVNQPI